MTHLLELHPIYHVLRSFSSLYTAPSRIWPMPLLPCPFVSAPDFEHRYPSETLLHRRNCVQKPWPMPSCQFQPEPSPSLWEGDHGHVPMPLEKPRDLLLQEKTVGSPEGHVQRLGVGCPLESPRRKVSERLSDENDEHKNESEILSDLHPTCPATVTLELEKVVQHVHVYKTARVELPARHRNISELGNATCKKNPMAALGRRVRSNWGKSRRW